MNWNLIENAGPSDVIFQECSEKKAAWLAEAQRVFPVGTEVVIKAVTEPAEDPAHIGRMGRVVDYDIGGIGCWPLIEVEFIERDGSNYIGVGRDGFYENEIAKRGE